jgi:hypothetical protein
MQKSGFFLTLFLLYGLKRLFSGGKNVERNSLRAFGSALSDFM